MLDRPWPDKFTYKGTDVIVRYKYKDNDPSPIPLRADIYLGPDDKDAAVRQISDNGWKTYEDAQKEARAAAEELIDQRST
ncbi:MULTISPECIES: hypothetical protein [Pseudomonas]|uniref:hypothetical protein n=1 Tax=Pseudomonas TaxID=286 RepID=UPI00259A7879|nr:MULTISPECIES: hypothetical protein [Pseudomonas]